VSNRSQYYNHYDARLRGAENEEETFGSRRAESAESASARLAKTTRSRGFAEGVEE
jgi:hypothetical protein